MISKNSKIDFILPIQSQYDVLHHFTKKIYEAFLRKGFTCRLITPSESLETQDNLPDFTFGINGVPFTEERKMLCDVTNIPHICYLIDPPFRFYELLSSNNIIFACDDAYNTRFLELKGKKAFFMPHGVDLLLSKDREEEKIYDIIFMGTFIDYENIRKTWHAQFPKILAQTLDDAAIITLEDGKTSLIEAFSMAYRDRLGLDKNWLSVDSEFMLPLNMLEMYIKGKERCELISSLSHLPVHLFGSNDSNGKGWKDALGLKCSLIQYHDAVNFENAINIMKKSKIVLNASSKNKEGGHERIFYGMGCGAVVVTNENLFMKKNYTDKENILLYDTRNYLNFNEEIPKIIKDEEYQKAIALKGKKEAFEHHSWDERIDVFL